MVIYHLTRIVDIRTEISDLGLSAFSSPCLRSCEAAVAPLSRGGTGPVERRTGSLAVTRRQSRQDASARRPSPRSRQISTDHTRRSLYCRTWEPHSYPASRTRSGLRRLVSRRAPIPCALGILSVRTLRQARTEALVRTTPA